jgi:hypothetical protein
MSTDERKADKMGVRNRDSMENLPTIYSGTLKANPTQPLEVGFIFCEKCKKNIPANYWRTHQQNHNVLHIDYLRKRYDSDTNILKQRR